MENLLETKRFNFQDTTATRRVFELKKRIRAVAGGTSASKTISILIWLIDYCQTQQGREKLASVVSETYPHLEKGAMLDFELIMKDRGYWTDARWNQTKHVYTFETGNKIEFFSVDTYEKAHGPRRDVLFVNECNHLSYAIVDQLVVRTREIIWLDWNPSEEFWFYTVMQPVRTDIDFLTLTYKDNEALDAVTIQEIESHKLNAQWWAVYGEGKLGASIGRIFTGWVQIDAVPDEARLERRGLDFGYSNDPTAILDIYRHNGGYIFDERCYHKGLSNKNIADKLKGMDYAPVLADSAEPKSIDEIYGYDVDIVGAKKGPGSVNQGIQFIQGQKIFVTKRSLNLMKEYRNYMWKKDRDGNITNIPEEGMDHLLDAARYGFDSFKPLSRSVFTTPPTQDRIYDAI